jgi:hypothetical protein
MKTLVRHITAYQFEELEAFAQEKAKENYLAEERLPEFFSDDLINELQEIYGLSHLKSYFSLSNCQGDGLCLYGRISHSELFDNEKFKKIAFAGIHYKQIQSLYDVLQQGIDFEHNSRYCHAKSVRIDIHCDDDTTDKQLEIIGRIIANIKSWYLSFCIEWEKHGYNYFFEISDSDMQEVCDEYDYLFTKSGELIDENEYKELVA